MRFLGNLIWLICGGLLSAVSWWFAGILWCITIIGMPVGMQCFKLSSITFNPFSKEVVYDEVKVTSFLLNVIWFVFSGMELAFVSFGFGCLLCITIVGIPFGMQHFKVARLVLMPFWARIVRV